MNHYNCKAENGAYDSKTRLTLFEWNPPDARIKWNWFITKNSWSWRKAGLVRLTERNGSFHRTKRIFTVKISLLRDKVWNLPFISKTRWNHRIERAFCEIILSCPVPHGWEHFSAKTKKPLNKQLFRSFISSERGFPKFLLLNFF